MPSIRHTILTLISLLAGSLFASNTFPLTDTSPNSPQFRAHFLGSYGINPAIEPKIDQTDLKLYQSIQPHLENNPQQAIQIASQAITPDSNPAFDFLLGSLHYSQQNYPTAERALQQAIQKFPSFRRAHRNLALIYIQQADYPKVIPHLLNVIKLGGGDGQSYSMLGYSYLNLEKYQSALSAYQMARMFLPDSQDVRTGEAQCLLMTNQLQPAIALLSELITEYPDNPLYWRLQANAYLNQQNHPDAIANLEIAHSLQTPDWQTHSLLADLYLSQDVTKKALQHYQAALTNHPDAQFKDALKPLKQLIERQHYTEAAAYIQTLNTQLQTPLTPAQTTDLAVYNAQIQIKTGDAPQAEQQLLTLLKQNPIHAPTLLALADYNLDTQNYPQATFYYQRASHLPEAKVQAHIGLARTNVQTNQFQQAIQHLEHAQNIQPRDDVQRFITSIQKAIAAQP